MVEVGVARTPQGVVAVLLGITDMVEIMLAPHHIGWVLVVVLVTQDRVLALPEEVMGLIILTGMVVLVHTMEEEEEEEFIMTTQ